MVEPNSRGVKAPYELKGSHLPVEDSRGRFHFSAEIDEQPVLPGDSSAPHVARCLPAILEPSNYFEVSIISS